jgi:hypothetical protein
VVTWAGTARSLEERVARGELIPFRAIATGKLRRAGNPLLMLTPSNARDMARVPVGVLQPRGAVREFGPDAVLATGGYVAIPVGLAAPPERAPEPRQAATHTAPWPRFPSAMRPWTPQHNALQRYKVTHAGTKQKRPA